MLDVEAVISGRLERFFGGSDNEAANDKQSTIWRSLSESAVYDVPPGVALTESNNKRMAWRARDAASSDDFEIFMAGSFSGSYVDMCGVRMGLGAQAFSDPNASRLRLQDGRERQGRRAALGGNSCTLGIPARR